MDAVLIMINHQKEKSFEGIYAAIVAALKSTVNPDTLGINIEKTRNTKAKDSQQLLNY